MMPLALALMMITLQSNSGCLRYNVIPDSNGKKVLCMTMSKNITSQWICLSLLLASSVRVVTLDDLNLYEMDWICQLPKLERLELHNGKLTGRCIDSMSSSGELLKITLNRMHIEESCRSARSQLRCYELEFVNCMINSEALHLTTMLKEAASLTISNCKVPEHDTMERYRITSANIIIADIEIASAKDAFYRGLSVTFPRLRYITIRKCDVSDLLFGEISKLKRIAHIALSECGTVNDSMIDIVLTCNKLQTLDIYGMTLSPESIRKLGKAGIYVRMGKINTSK